MEVKTELSAPSSGIHDIKYFYTIVQSLSRRGEKAEKSDKTFEYFRRMINNYNEAKASMYGLSFRPREINIETVKRATFELIDLKIITEDDGYLTLTDAGKDVAMLIERRDAEKLKKVFTKLMLEKYSIFEYFLKRIKSVFKGEGLPLPFITSDIHNQYGGNSKKIAENYINILNRICPNVITKPDRLYSSIDKASIDLIKQKTVKIKKLQAVIEKHVVSEVFQSIIESRRMYDVIRSRTTFLELTNYAIIDIDGFPAEITYLISDFEPSFRHTMDRVDYIKGTIYLNRPSFEELREQFKDSLIKTYIGKKDEFGYARIAEVRDMVCRELRISDSLFDIYLKRLYKDEPHLLSFTYLGAGEKITEKRLPLIIEEPIREFFTLLRVNLKR
ncbi:MAG: hypothetical protein QXQ94_10275 [Candidatus Bathyarchaeia archaeon]